MTSALVVPDGRRPHLGLLVRLYLSELRAPLMEDVAVFLHLRIRLDGVEDGLLLHCVLCLGHLELRQRVGNGEARRLPPPPPGPPGSPPPLAPARMNPEAG